MAHLFAYIPHKNGQLDDTAAELAHAAGKMNDTASVTAIVTGSGSDLDSACQLTARIFPKVWKCDNTDLAYPNAEIVRKVLIDLLPAGAVLLAAHDHFGMDLAPGLSIKLNSAFVSDIVGIDGMEESILKVVRQEYAGLAHTHVTCDLSTGAVLTLRPGVFQPSDSTEVSGQVEDKSGSIGDLSVRRRFIEVIEAETGSVDITKSDVLVSIGRGIKEEENIAMAEELAKAMGAVVSCSRPIVDARWLEKSRQVGTSGKTVKPKVYLALGISGSFQHLGGLKGSPFIVGVNKNAKAPIFQVADVGIVEDILEFIPALTTRILDDTK